MPGCVFWLLRFPDSWRPSLCCAESEDSSDIELNSENSVQPRLCFLLSAARTSHRDSKYCTLSFNCVQVQTLPTAQAASALTDSFFVGLYDPYNHPCKARPLTTVGRTSLSVIVIVIDNKNYITGIVWLPSVVLLLRVVIVCIFFFLISSRILPRRGRERETWGGGAIQLQSRWRHGKTVSNNNNSVPCRSILLHAILHTTT